jgi:hypothetical protein
MVAPWKGGDVSGQKAQSSSAITMDYLAQHGF